nr:hypothetical protein [Tanacetum cinerariifolium]
DVEGSSCGGGGVVEGVGDGGVGLASAAGTSLAATSSTSPAACCGTNIPSIKDVKGICRVSPMKSKVAGKSDSPRRRWILLSERVSNKHGDIVVNAQPVSQYNPVTVQVVKEGDKVQQPKVKPVVDEKDNPKVKLAVVKEKPAVVKEKTAGVTSKVSKGKDDVVKAPVVADEVPVIVDKELVVKATVADKAPVVKATVADNVVADKQPVKEKSADTVGKAPVKDKVKVFLLEGSLAPVKDNVKAPVKDNVEVSVLKGNLLVDIVLDDMLLNKAMGKASIKNKFKAPVKDKVEDNVKVPVKDKPNKKDNVKAPVKDKPKQKVMPTVQELSEVLVLRSSNQKVKPKVKSKVVVRVSRLKETPVKRKRILSKEDDRKKKLKGKSKKEDSDSELETDDVDSSSDEVDRKRKKMKIKAGLMKKRSGSDCSDSSSIDTENIKRLISKLEKKVKKQDFDEESVSKKGKKKLTKKVKKEESNEEIVPKKGKKKEKKLTPEEAAHEEYLLSFLTSHARTTPFSLFSAIRNSRVDLSFLSGIGFSSLHNVFIDQLPSKLGREADHEFLVAAQDIDFLFKVNFLTLFTNTMGKCVGLKGQICLDVVRRLREDSVISDIDWCGYIYDCLQGNLHGEWTEVEVQDGKGLIGSSKTFEKKWNSFTLIVAKCTSRRITITSSGNALEHFIALTASLEYPDDGKFLVLYEKYVNLFKDLISFNDDGNRDNGRDDDDGNRDNDGDACGGPLPHGSLDLI